MKERIRPRDIDEDMPQGGIVHDQTVEIPHSMLELLVRVSRLVDIDTFEEELSIDEQTKAWESSTTAEFIVERYREEGIREFNVIDPHVEELPESDYGGTVPTELPTESD